MQNIEQKSSRTLRNLESIIANNTNVYYKPVATIYF